LSRNSWSSHTYRKSASKSGRNRIEAGQREQTGRGYARRNMQTHMNTGQIGGKSKKNIILPSVVLLVCTGEGTSSNTERD
jgi:hypothetical protein